MPSVRYTYGSSFDINFNSAIAISGEIYDSDEAKYKFRAQIDPDEGGSVVSQLYNGTSNLSEDYILSSHVVSFKMDFSSNTEGVSLYGYDYDDIMNGGRGNDAFSGGAGNDTLRGMGGIDQFWADDGNDRIVVREAGASVSGGEGHDRLFLQGADSYSFSDDTLSGIEAIHVGAGANLDLSAVSAGVAIVMASKIGSPSNIVGTQGDDVITAGGGFVSIKAGDGDDVIKGGSGTANLLGEDGDDVIALGKGGKYASGGDGDDVIVGSDHVPSVLNGDAGNDRIKAGDAGATIAGGTGADKLFAGSGDDTFIFQAGFGRDGVYGFDVDADRIFVSIAGVEEGDLVFRPLNGGQNTLVTFEGLGGGNKIILHDVTVAELEHGPSDLFLFGA
ncbi:RTX-I toxin determinant A from serotypes 1/9 [Methylobacterium bullatum]|uniref:RTX-I toxin determinant A from serotypes 1/9 n=1 Tax=Methylobacterium bullatum TaxID=570505 RepID=A0A679JK45_9HYPH|nr:RTX-I toxin determinant A from serotypes 1/9 [Methylobacterium bullatum]